MSLTAGSRTIELCYVALQRVLQFVALLFRSNESKELEVPTSMLKLIAVAALAVAGFQANAFTQEKDRLQHWVGTWSASPVAPSNPGFTEKTVRLIVHTSVGGSNARVRLSNAFSSQSLAIGAAHIALRSTGEEIVPDTDRVLTFGGVGSTTIPPGALALSDPVEMDVPALSDLAVSIYFPGPVVQATAHPGSHQRNYVSPPGDFTAEEVLPIASTSTSWFYLTDVEVKSSEKTSAIVALGDSITDGSNSTMDANRRWPDDLAVRLRARHFKRSVLNEGISGNRILHDSTGPNALARLDRDVLTKSGVAYVIVLLGINDIGRSPTDPVSADEIIAGHLQIIERVHERGLKIFGCTLTPFEGAGYFTAEGEDKREAVNEFIRTGGTYDGVIDFDLATNDPSHPTRFLPAFDSGDHLHPNDAGLQAMADAVRLSLFRERDDR
jgi:lysophospholipase L1-like esterase